MDEVQLRQALEALLFVSDEPMSAGSLAQAVEVDRRTVELTLQAMAADYEARSAGLAMRNVAGGWRLSTHPDAAPFVEQFVLSNRHARLTKAGLETLSIVAYKQPVTRHQLAAIRGVNSDGVLRALSDRGLVSAVGRDEGPGRPVLYGAAPDFLDRVDLPPPAECPPLAPLLGAPEEA